MSATETASVPQWATAAVAAYWGVRAGGSRPVRFNLTETQAEELRKYTGQTATLLGLPVKVRA